MYLKLFSSVSGSVKLSIWIFVRNQIALYITYFTLNNNQPSIILLSLLMLSGVPTPRNWCLNVASPLFRAAPPRGFIGPVLATSFNIEKYWVIISSSFYAMLHFFSLISLPNILDVIMQVYNNLHPHFAHEEISYF